MRKLLKRFKYVKIHQLQPFHAKIIILCKLNMSLDRVKLWLKLLFKDYAIISDENLQSSMDSLVDIDNHHYKNSLQFTSDLSGIYLLNQQIVCCLNTYTSSIDSKQKMHLSGTCLLTFFFRNNSYCVTRLLVQCLVLLDEAKKKKTSLKTRTGLI